MIAEVGHFSLLLALALSLIQGFAPIWGAMRGNVQLMQLSSNLSFVQFFFVSLAFFCLVFVYIVSDFSVLNVWQNSHSSNPMIYKITAVWGNHEGSMLLWIFFLSLFSALLALFGSNLSMRLKANALAVQGLIGSAFLLFLIFASNPFLRLDPALGDGQGLNPILQDLSLAIHPPLLYIGYVGFSVAFSLAIAALIEGKTNAVWALGVHHWVLLSWMFLTGGIATGSWWAYYELGWGGWWFWDPVENVSLMPWLSGTALLHSVIVMEKREALKVWTVFLAILTFSLSLLGTFVVRSGILTSVHAFAIDPLRGLFILFILGLFVGGGLAIFMWRAPMLRQGVLFAPVSKEGALILNNLLLVSALASVFLGTFYPLFLEYLSGVKISVGAPFFNMTFGSLMCLSFIILPFGQMLSWRYGDLLGVAQRLSVVAGIAILGSLVIVLVHGKYSPLSFFGIGLSLWIIVGAVFETVWRMKLFRIPLTESLRILKNIPRSFMGSMLAHAGVGVTLLGIVSASTWREEVITLMSLGDSIMIADYVVVLDDISFRQGADYVERVGVFSVHHDDVIVKEIEASQRRYLMPAQTTSEVGIGLFPTRDVYIVLGDMTGQEKNVVHVYSSPLVMLIWCGAGLMILGGCASLSARRLYTSKLRRSPLSKPDSVSRLYLSCCAFVMLLSVCIDDRVALAAIQPDEILTDPLLESRARELSAQFRCVVCQSQSINESDAALARAMRVRVRDRLKMGDSDDEVIAHFVARYGDFILLKPPLQANTLFLWGLPPFIFLLGIWIAWRSVIERRHDIRRAQQRLSPDEEPGIRALLDELHAPNDVIE